GERSKPERQRRLRVRGSLHSAARGESPSPGCHLRCHPTSPRKRGEVRFVFREMKEDRAHEQPLMTRIDRDAAVALIEPLTELVARAGAAILAVDRRTMISREKADGSPVTEADLAADRVLAEGLARLVPDVPSLSEERSHLTKLSTAGSFFLIDPLDGTKEFLAGRDEFTVNLALVTDGVPLLGIISAPPLGLIWRGLVGRGAERLTIAGGSAQPIHTRPMPPPGKPWIAAVSRSHGERRTEAFIERRPG